MARPYAVDLREQVVRREKVRSEVALGLTSVPGTTGRRPDSLLGRSAQVRVREWQTAGVEVGAFRQLAPTNRGLAEAEEALVDPPGHRVVLAGFGQNLAAGLAERFQDRIVQLPHLRVVLSDQGVERRGVVGVELGKQTDILGRGGGGDDVLVVRAEPIPKGLVDAKAKAVPGSWNPG